GCATSVHFENPDKLIVNVIVLLVRKSVLHTASHIPVCIVGIAFPSAERAYRMFVSGIIGISSG
ncbi:MAG TPA: hypothetical protein VK909_01405, partial [Anaerolineales bacterium]|nr:hypothetical protein [Anaerolineales bacterium]